MLATFMLVHPVAVAIAFVAASVATVYVRSARPFAVRSPDSESAARENSDAPVVAVAPTEAVAGWALVVTAAATLLLSILLVASATAVSHTLLVLFALSAAFLLSVELYRRRRSRLTFESAVLCIMARLGVWLIVLLLIGQPRWGWVIVDWEEPLLAVLLDQSKSMSITDRDSPGEQSRAALTNQAIVDAGPWIERLNDLYEVRVFGIGESHELLENWRVQPRAAVTAIAAALRRVGQARSVAGEPPVAVVLVSDGAETAVSPRVVRDAAAELASQGTALVAVGVGPETGLSPAVVLEPLVVPGRIGSRDRLRTPVGAQVSACAGHTLQVAVFWGNEQADERRIRIRRADQRINPEFELQPPGVGLHRLTARATLPAELGGESVETSTVVDVRDDRIRVLVLSGQPRSELAFATRAISSDPRFEVTQQLLMTDSKSDGEDAIGWSGHDVVILGDVPQNRLGFDTLKELADAVRRRGVGLLMVGGRDFYHEGYYSRSELAEISPAAFKLARPPDGYHPRFRPTELGRRHPILIGIGAGDALPAANDPPHDIWAKLPVLSGAAALGKPKPLAAILATDSRDRPLLLALDAGRGRTVAAAWDSTWPWGLSSEEGLAAHGTLWRQMVAWLANRRPVAWLVTDRSSYARAALVGGQQSLRIRAGLSGIETPTTPSRHTEYQASLELRLVRAADDVADETQPAVTPASQPAPTQTRWQIPLERHGGEWRSELPRDLPAQTWLTSGEYELYLVIDQGTAGSTTGNPRPLDSSGNAVRTLDARTGFVVSAVDPEYLEPTANLAALRIAAARTEAAGGGYYPIAELPVAVQQLAEQDRRLRIERQASYDLVRRKPWLLFVLVILALALEWFVRKRGGLA